jgi:hypothetical protein
LRAVLINIFDDDAALLWLRDGIIRSKKMIIIRREADPEGLPYGARHRAGAASWGNRFPATIIRSVLLFTEPYGHHR